MNDKRKIYVMTKDEWQQRVEADRDHRWDQRDSSDPSPAELSITCGEGFGCTLLVILALVVIVYIFLALGISFLPIAP